MPALLSRLWFILKTLAMRGRFLTGKASFVRARVSQVVDALAEVYDRRGRPLGAKMLSQHRLENDPPRSGMQGWSLFAAQAEAAAVVPPGRSILVSLECGFCKHYFLINILQPEPADRPLSTSGDPTPASYAASWFSFMTRDYQGEASLACPRCEQSSLPGVRFLKIRGRRKNG